MNYIRQNFYLFVLFIIASLYVLLFSDSTSPFLLGWSVDQQIFQYIGFAIVNGKIPYTEIFDHKGIILFLINGFGYIINKDWGIALLQILNLSFSMLLWYKSMDKIKNVYHKLIIVLIGLFCLYAYYDGGDLTEEWSLLLISYPFYAYFNNISKGNNYFCFRQLFLIGLCLGMGFLIRVNNVSAIFGLLLYCFIKAIISKDYRYIQKAFIGIIFGCTLSIVAATIYMFMVGGILGVHDMFYGTLFFNIEYMQSYGKNEQMSLFGYLRFMYKVLLPALVLFASGRKNMQCSVPLLLGYIFTTLTLGKVAFTHYLMVYIPLIVYTVMCLYKSRLKYVLLVLLLIPFGNLNIKKGIPHNLEIGQYDYAYESLKKIIASIPEDERANIWNYNGTYHLRDFIKLNIVQQNRVVFPFLIDISKELQKKEIYKVQEIKPNYIIFFDYAFHVNRDFSRYSGTESDLCFMNKYYKVHMEEILADGTRITCYKKL